MKTISKETTEALAELIVINNDRYEGYTKAAEQTKDDDLKTLFTKFAAESKKFGEDLRKLIPFEEKTPRKDETTFSGKVYRAWMDIRKALSVNDRKAILSSCEFGEDVALKTYANVLKHPEDITSDILELVRQQQTSLKSGHDKVKALRDATK